MRGLAALSWHNDTEIEGHGQDRAKDQGEDESRAKVELKSQEGKGEKSASGDHMPVGFPIRGTSWLFHLQDRYKRRKAIESCFRLGGLQPAP